MSSRGESSVGVRPRVLGRSVEGRPIEAVFLGQGERPRLIFGGFHGDEPKSVDLARRLCAELSRDASALGGRALVVVPLVNPDGYARRNRRNARGVDLNRNFPTKDWSSGPRRRRYYGGPAPASEPETRAVVRLITRLRPADIITIHSIDRQRYCNNYDGPTRGAVALAKAMAACNGYPVTGSIGYPTPGSFGTWAGHERRIATVTLELPSHHSSRRCWEDNRRALLADLWAIVASTSDSAAGRFESSSRTTPADGFGGARPWPD